MLGRLEMEIFRLLCKLAVFRTSEGLLTVSRLNQTLIKRLSAGFQHLDEVVVMGSSKSSQSCPGVAIHDGIDDRNIKWNGRGERQRVGCSAGTRVGKDTWHLTWTSPSNSNLTTSTHHHHHQTLQFHVPSRPDLSSDRPRRL